MSTDNMPQEPASLIERINKQIEFASPPLSGSDTVTLPVWQWNKIAIALEQRGERVLMWHYRKAKSGWQVVPNGDADRSLEPMVEYRWATLDKEQG